MVAQLSWWPYANAMKRCFSRQSWESTICQYPPSVARLETHPTLHSENQPTHLYTTLYPCALCRLGQCNMETRIILFWSLNHIITKYNKWFQDDAFRNYYTKRNNSLSSELFNWASRPYIVLTHKTFSNYFITKYQLYISLLPKQILCKLYKENCKIAPLFKIYFYFFHLKISRHFS